MSGDGAPHPAYDLDSPLWRFSLEVYAAPGVQQQCLALQERCGVDVNLLLFAAWMGARHGRRLDENDLSLLRDAVRDWHDGVVRPLRAARLAIKALAASAPVAACADLKAGIARDELAAEQIEQALLLACLPRMALAPIPLQGDTRREIARANLSLVVSSCTGGAADDGFDAILAASFAAT